MGELGFQDFMTVVKNAPLVSIDIFFRDSDGRVLVGLRRNAPARGFWFVPGGRVRKGERLHDAFGRICETEAGISASLEQARLLGVDEHFYESDNAGGLLGVDTHYVVLSFELLGIDSAVSLSEGQHSASEWRSVSSLQPDPQVHENAKRMLGNLTPNPADSGGRDGG